MAIVVGYTTFSITKKEPNSASDRPLRLGMPGQAAHSSKRRNTSVSPCPKRMREPHNRNGTP